MSNDELIARAEAALKAARDLYEARGVVSLPEGRYMISGGSICPEQGEIIIDLIAALRAEKEARERAEVERDEARRRRDEWRKKAEGYDAVCAALREKVGAPWPPHLSRLMWAGLAAAEKKRADDAEAALDRIRQEAADEALEQAAQVIEWTPSRQERLGGQSFAYIKQGETIAAIRAMKGGAK